MDKRICLLSTGVPSAIRGLEQASLERCPCGNQERPGLDSVMLGGPSPLLPPPLVLNPAPGGIAREP